MKAFGFELTDHDALRFWAKVDECGPDECWPWTASRHRQGYGHFRVGGRLGRIVEAHRVAFALDNGHEAEGEVLHRCDYPPCCNPAHVWDGDKAQNMEDMASKGRSRSPRPGNGHTKIDAAASLAIYEMCRTGSNFSQAARKFGVKQPTARAHYRKHANG